MDTAGPAWELPPDTRRPLPEVIEDKIELLISDGEIEWGSTLPNENELARIFGVGRSSLRTALQRLQLRGLVDVARGRGWTVAPGPPVSRDAPTDAELAERAEFTKLVELRTAIEATATRIAAREATDLEINAIVDAHDAHRVAGARPDVAVQELVQTDEAFHAAVIDAAHMPVLNTIYEILLPQIRRLRKARFGEFPSTARESAEGHALIVTFLKRRDSGAGTAMEMHVRTFAPVLEQVGAPARPRG